MLLRLTTIEAFLRLINYLEAERNLVWPDLHTEESFRDYYIGKIQEEMQKGETVLLRVEWEYDYQRGKIVSKVSYSLFSDISTDESYLQDETKHEDKI